MATTLAQQTKEARSNAADRAGKARPSPELPGDSGSTSVWPLFAYGLAWAAGLVFLAYMAILRFRVDPP